MDSPEVFCRFRDMYSDRMQKAVGMLFLTAGSVESTLSMMIASLASYPNQMNHRLPFVFSGMDLRVKIQKLNELCIGTGVDGEKVRKITGKIEKLFAQRNAIAHNLGMPKGDTITVRFIRLYRGGLKPDEIFTAERIENIAALMFMRLRELGDLIPNMPIEGETSVLAV